MADSGTDGNGVVKWNFTEGVKVDTISKGNSDDTSSKETKKVKPPTVPYRHLYRYANTLDIILIMIGTLTATIHGAGLPLLFVFFGDLTSTFTEFGTFAACEFNYTQCTELQVFNGTEAEFDQTMIRVKDLESSSIQFIYNFVYVACGVFVCATFQVGCFSYQAVRQSKRIRTNYFRGILRQDIGFHDLTSAGELNARLSDDVKKIQDGMGDKVSLVIQNIMMVVVGLIIAFIYSWKLTLVTLSVSPLLAAASAMMFSLSTKYTKKELDSYAIAGSIADEAISSIRTVVAFGIQEEQIKRYVSNLGEAKTMAMKKGVISGSSLGFLYLAMFSMYALSFWYGITLIIEDGSTLVPGDMIVVFFNVLIVAFALGTAGANTQYFSSASAAAAKIFEVIDRVPEIDIFSEDGLKPSECSGNVEFNDVHFSYPSRSDVEVLKGINLSVDKGQTVALVGQSGCGKSTSVALIQRFYDCTDGSILVDGVDVKKLNLHWLREKIGVVAQEPVLFDTSIMENIRWGRDGVSDDEVIEAAKKANAFDFIEKLPQKFETLVGESGGQMSGGQKQRIAIARAIVRDPKILLLDEATSALDTESESVVQSALEKASAGRTTVVIAHRLSTVRNADKIIAFYEGNVMEEGTHEELLRIPDGVYNGLVNMQMVDAEREGTPVILKDADPVLTGSVEKINTSEVSFKSSRVSIRKRITSNSSMRSHKGEKQDKRGVEEEEEEVEEEEDLPDAPVKRILILNKPEWGYIGFGLFFAMIAGAVEPVNAIIFADVLTIFTLGDPVEQSRLATQYALIFFGLGVIAFIAYVFESLLFSKSGSELTQRLREIAFRSMLYQDISYFDDHTHSTGALCTRLATDASRVQGCTGVRLGTILKNFAALGVSLGIAFAYGWQLTLLTMAFVPFLILGGFLEMTLLIGQEEKESQAYEEAGKIASEATNNIRTVASLTKEEKIYQTYSERLAGPVKKATKKAIYTGLGYGFSQCVIYFAYAGVFRLGIELVMNGQMTFDNVFKVLTAVIFGAMAVGQNSSYAPDYAEAKVSASRMFKLFDQQPEIDASSKKGHSPASCQGQIEFKAVKFLYPTRPDMLVLKGCNLSVPRGQTLALVGQSGCGKSTCVQLIERFYDTLEGQVTLDDTEIKELNIAWLRQQMGIVSQEPVLFNLTIKENILYGDLSREYTQEEVVKAATNANIHSFIASLPQGYDTNVGPKGGQLSGGQKQRVAIARALLRNPKILLLDEATSALDTESEKVVQEALDNARQGRTCIVIAHRLSTVKNADMIAVVDNGVIVETGTHDELIASGGPYYSLVNAQLTHQE